RNDDFVSKKYSWTLPPFGDMLLYSHYMDNLYGCQPVKMSSFGYFIFRFFLRANEKANVKGPIFPKNIIKMIIAFPIIVKCGVKFILRPTVPNAENTSKTLINRGTRSVILKIKIAKKINEIEIMAMVNDLTMRVSLMDFLNTTI